MNSKIQHKLEELTTDNSSGASELVNKAIDLIDQYLDSITQHNDNKIKQECRALFKTIIESRPSMAPLINTIGFLETNITKYSKEQIKNTLLKLKVKRLNQQKILKSNFQEFFNENYKPNLKIMIISYSSTLLGILLNLNKKDLIFYVLESRPLLEGFKTTEKLAEVYETHLIIDAALGKYIDQIDFILLGVDSILKDGSIINKIGTYPLSVMGYEHNKNIIVLGDSFKYNLQNHFGKMIKIEKKPSNEITERMKANDNIIIENYYFDLTPSKYITKIISDLGIQTPLQFIDKVKSNLPIEWFKTYL